MTQEKLQAQLLHLQWLTYMLAVSMNSSAEKWQSLSEGLDHLDQMLNPPKFDIDKACDAAMARVQAQIDASCGLHSHAIACRFAAVKREMSEEASIWETAASQVSFRNAYHLRNGWPTQSTAPLNIEVELVRRMRNNYSGEN